MEIRNLDWAGLFASQREQGARPKVAIGLLIGAGVVAQRSHRLNAVYLTASSGSSHSTTVAPSAHQETACLPKTYLRLATSRISSHTEKGS